MVTRTSKTSQHSFLPPSSTSSLSLQVPSSSSLVSVLEVGTRRYHSASNLKLIPGSSSPSVKYFSTSEAPLQQKQTNEGGKVGGGGSGNEVKHSVRAIPTRHSSKHIPSIAPHDILDNATDKILSSTPGTLFAYESSYLNQSKQEEYETGLSVSYHHQEQVEYLLRGYSSLLPNSIVHLQSPQSPNHPMYNREMFTSGKIDIAQMDIAEEEQVVDKMIQLIERMETEGSVYIDLRSKLRSQMALVSGKESDSAAAGINTEESDSSDSDSDSSSDSDGGSSDGDDATEEDKGAWRKVQLVENYGAPPGPSAAMYDLTLDAIANIIRKTSDPITYLKKAMDLFQSSISRNESDRKQEMDVVNLKSIPTAATFNALIRISSNVEKDTGKSQGHNDEVRDEALSNAFQAFNSMNHHPHVHRNSATYHYLIRTVNKFFPDCKSKGYILATFWDKCILTDAVLDENVIQAFLDVKTDDCGEDVHLFFKKRVVDVYDPEVKNGYGFPLKYSRNKKKKRFDKMLDVY